MRIKKRTQHQKMVNDDDTIETEAVAPSVINKITRETLQQKEWKRVKKILKRQGINNSFDEDLLPIEMNKGEGNGNILHQVLRYNPPLQVLKQIVGLLEREHEDYSFLLEETDDELNKSRLPLHVAIAYGSSFDVIDFLVDCCPISAYYKDKNGQSPLHLACFCNNNAHAAAQACKKDEEKDCFDCELQQEQIISKLISAAPDFLLREDSFRMTPKEIAIRSGCCSDRIVSMLNELTLKQREFVRERMMVISTTVFNSMK